MLKKLLPLIALMLYASTCFANNYNEQFINAVASGSIRLAERALDNGANVDYRPPFRLTALTLAARNRRPALVQMLLARNADPNLAASNGFSLDTPLLYAVYNDDLESARLLLENGADPNIARVIEGQIRVNIPLRQAGNRPNRGNGYELGYEIKLEPEFRSQRATPLIFAIQKENNDNPSEEMVALLLAHGANPNQANSFGYTPLMAASELKMFSRKFIRLNIAQQLLDSGADPSAQDNFGNTALNYAQSTRFREMVDLLAPLTN